MSAYESLIKAKALVDTIEKWEAMGRSTSRAIYEATTNWEDYFEADRLMACNGVRGFGWESKMHQFDLAIKEADENE
jgi:hypothetical protein